MPPLDDDTLDRTFSALAHPVRRAILGRLARGEVASVTDLAEPFDISLVAVSRHVGVLEEAGLISRKREGRVRWCRYEEAAISEAKDWIETHQRYWSTQLDALARYLKGGE
ncbi:MAG: helix-turn-helix transcriptional regulator [Gemmatimonadetes bacterium]|nr:helix-turn-helix transcriptional regulator [Gemmatimonadota bacterium]